MRLTASIVATLSLGLLVTADSTIHEVADPANLIASDGCAVTDFKFPATPGGPSKALKIGDRVVRVTLPKNYVHGTPAPLILAYHDVNMTAADFEDLTHLSDESYNPDAIVVYPKPLEGDRWQSHWDPPQRANDVAFTSKIIDRVSSRLCVDKDRIYATGMGTGGGMVHLISCNGQLSTRIAAFSIINGLLMMGFKSGNQKLEIKDPTSLLWHNCKSKRIPTRLLNIHGENNKIYDYWGENEINDRRLLPIVRWLVDWSARNGCGGGLSMPSRWRGGKDPVHKTDLEYGHIFEGMIENSTVIKATYHCWPSSDMDMEEQLAHILRQLPPELLKKSNKGEGEEDEEYGEDYAESESAAEKGEGEEYGEHDEKSAESESAAEVLEVDEIEKDYEDSTASESAAEVLEGDETKENNEDPATSESTAQVPDDESEVATEPQATISVDDSDLEQLRGSLLTEHYFVRGFGYGWPRVKKEPARINKEGKPEPTWERVWETIEARNTESVEAQANVNFKQKGLSPFDYGFMDPNPSRTPAFDATERTLNFFRAYKLSDVPGRGPKTSAPLENSEDDDDSSMDDIVQKIQNQVEANKNSLENRKNEIAADLPAGEGILDIKGKKEEPKEAEPKEKDEL